MPWTDPYTPEVDDFDLDQWLIDNGYGSEYVDGLTVGTEMSDYTSSDGTDPIDDDAIIADLWTLDSLSNNPLAVGGIEAFMWQWMTDPENEGADNATFGAELFTQMFVSAQDSAQQDFIEAWNESFADDQIEYSEDPDELAANIAYAAQQWGTMYGEQLDYTNWFSLDGSATTNELGDLIAEINADTQEFNDAWITGPDGWGSLVTAATAQAETIYGSKAQALLDDYNSRLTGFQAAGQAAKSQYAMAAASDRNLEASRGLHKKQSNFLSDGSVSMKRIRNELKGVNTGLDWNVENYENEAAQNSLDWEAYLAGVFGVGGFQGNYELAYELMLNGLDEWVTGYNTDVNLEAQSSFTDMWEQLNTILIQGGMVPPTGGGFENQYWWQDQEEWEGDWDLGDGNCILASGEYGTICGEWTDHSGQCVADGDACYEGQIGGGDWITCEDGSQVPVQAGLMMCPEYQVDCTCPEGQIPEPNTMTTPWDCPPCIPDPDWIDPGCEEPAGGCPSDKVWSQVQCVCVSPSGPGYTDATLMEEEVELWPECPPGQYYYQGSCIGDMS